MERAASFSRADGFVLFVYFNDASNREGGGFKVKLFPSEFLWDKCFAIVNCLPDIVLK
jgi:hypothetical protein